MESYVAYPRVVKVYRKRYIAMARPEYIKELVNYARHVLHDPLEPLDWKLLLYWVHRHFEYTKEELPKPRAELPMDIIAQAKGRCGEFALLYNGALLTNGYRTRLIIDCSTLKDKSRRAAGDHVWVEVLINGIWVHVDPTEKRIDAPLMYAVNWEKDVNLVYAITDREIVDVTKTYQQ
ncbi:MAG TPA: transglutaminase-like domain-containing protein [Candidatus Bathyarchaeia archaeon]